MLRDRNYRVAELLLGRPFLIHAFLRRAGCGYTACRYAQAARLGGGPLLDDGVLFDRRLGRYVADVRPTTSTAVGCPVTGEKIEWGDESKRASLVQGMHIFTALVSTGIVLPASLL